jgi:sugar lactone lactonase YvrE
VTGLQRGRGSTVGPDGALYVTEAAAGRISRVDPEDGTVTKFASGLPISGNPAGGVVDVAFLGRTAYALVTLVSPEVGGTSANGIYRVDGPHHFTLIADIGAFSAAHVPPHDYPIALKTGVQFALESFRGGFLVTDGHHNRVLRVTRDGEISTLMQFGNIVPTGITVRGNRVYMAEAGPVPHLPQNGKVVTFRANSPTATEVAAGAPLLVGVEFRRGRTLFALSQGNGNPGAPPGSPALPNTGSLVRVNRNGTFTVITGGLDRPTSLNFIGSTAYIVTLTGEVWTIDDVGGQSLEEED